jgi:hypothetical protein
MATVIAKIFPANSGIVEKTKLKNIEVQYKPETGSEPFPLMASLSTLSALIRF